jgi:hypothetical protein
MDAKDMIEMVPILQPKNKKRSEPKIPTLLPLCGIYVCRRLMRRYIRYGAPEWFSSQKHFTIEGYYALYKSPAMIAARFRA